MKLEYHSYLMYKPKMKMSKIFYLIFVQFIFGLGGQTATPHPVQINMPPLVLGQFPGKHELD
jgi:hypothetical protein